MLKEIDDESFHREVGGPGRTVLLLAYAPWCGDCRRILPVFENLSVLPEYQEVSFLQADVTKNTGTKRTLGVERYPTLCLFRDGRKVAERVAEVSAEEQKAIIQTLLRDCGSH